VNDDGGGIFTTLEHGEPARERDFERIFGTPTGTDIAALCRAHGVAHQRAATEDDLRRAVTEPATGIRVVEVLVDRGSHRPLRERLRQAARGDG
jgi:2-succinyl-5-enolpyruvyl-6-hydroxy-3-cyclohexene-1-carboxylate synthase